MVGVVVCNMQDSNSVTFPHVNLAVPIPTITTIINTFLKTKGKEFSQAVVCSKENCNNNHSRFDVILSNI